MIRSRRYDTETMIDVVYADDSVLLTSRTTLTDSLLEQITKRIGLYVNANKTEFTRFKPEG